MAENLVHYLPYISNLNYEPYDAVSGYINFGILEEDHIQGTFSFVGKYGELKPTVNITGGYFDLSN